jgi:hypothetical protein
LLAVSTIIGDWTSMISFKVNCVLTAVISLTSACSRVRVVLSYSATCVPFSVLSLTMLCHLTAIQPQIRSLACLCGIYVGQDSTGIGFSLVFFGFPQSVSIHQGCTISLRLRCIRGLSRRTLKKMKVKMIIPPMLRTHSYIHH